MIEIPQARRLEKPRWINLRTGLGLLLFTGSLIAGQQMVGTTTPQVQLWVAAADVPAGSTLGPTDLRSVGADIPADSMDLYALSSTDLVGAYVVDTVPAGQFVPLSSLSEAPPSGSRHMTIPVAPEHAVGGSLAAGDRVDVIVTLDPGRPTARTSVLVSEVEVLGVVEDSGNFGGAGQAIGITIAVSADDAPKLALAIRTGEVDVVRVVGSSSTHEGAVTSEDL